MFYLWTQLFMCVWVLSGIYEPDIGKPVASLSFCFSKQRCCLIHEVPDTCTACIRRLWFHKTRTPMCIFGHRISSHGSCGFLRCVRLLEEPCKSQQSYKLKGEKFSGDGGRLGCWSQAGVTFCSLNHNQGLLCQKWSHCKLFNIQEMLKNTVGNRRPLQRVNFNT